MPSTEAAIYRNFFSHLYIVMGQEQPLNSGKRIVRIYFNPFIILIWSGAFLMAFGGLISICDKKEIGSFEIYKLSPIIFFNFILFFILEN